VGLFILCRSHWRAWALLGDGASPRWGDCRVIRSADQAEFAAGCDCILAGIDPELAVDGSGVAARRSRPPATACRRATAPSSGAVRPPPATGSARRVLGGQRDPGRHQDQDRVVHDCCRAAARPARTARSRAASGRHGRSGATAPRVRKFLTPPQGHSRPSHFPRAALTLPRLQATHDRVPACHNG
jgi:hypothetical protein